MTVNNAEKMVITPQNIILLVFSCSLFLICVVSQLVEVEVDHRTIKCLVCKQVVQDIIFEVEKVNPNRKIEVGGYQIDDSGNQRQRVIEYRKSEIFLTEVLDSVCKNMENYVKAKHKYTGEILVMNLMDEGKMNPLMSEVDIIQDIDLNKNLKHYCEEILELHDEMVVEQFMKDIANPVKEICVDSSQLCESIDPIIHKVDTAKMVETVEEILSKSKDLPETGEEMGSDEEPETGLEGLEEEEEDLPETGEEDASIPPVKEEL